MQDTRGKKFKTPASSLAPTSWFKLLHT